MSKDLYNKLLKRTYQEDAGPYPSIVGPFESISDMMNNWLLNEIDFELRNETIKMFNLSNKKFLSDKEVAIEWEKINQSKLYRDIMTAYRIRKGKIMKSTYESGRKRLDNYKDISSGTDAFYEYRRKTNLERRIMYKVSRAVDKRSFDWVCFTGKELLRNNCPYIFNRMDYDKLITPFEEALKEKFNSLREVKLPNGNLKNLFNLILII